MLELYITKMNVVFMIFYDYSPDVIWTGLYENSLN